MSDAFYGPEAGVDASPADAGSCGADAVTCQGAVASRCSAGV
jgi:hypothetical protein